MASVHSKSEIRVFMTADPIGGVWTFALDLMTALRSYGVEFGLATMGRPLTSEQLHQVSQLPNVRLYESDFKLEWMNDPWEDVRLAGDWLLRSAADFKPDLIHLNGYVHASLPWEKPVLVAAHSCVYSWFRSVKGLPPPAKIWDTYYHQVRRGLSAADWVTAPTREMLYALRIHYENTFSRGSVIYNGRDPALFQPRPNKGFILTGGRLWDEAKNIQTLDRAAAAIRWPVAAAGEIDPPNGGQIKTHHLKQLGPLSPAQFAVQLSLASIYALPAHYEPFGLSALEAALSGCALVLSDIPSLREIWDDAAIFVAPKDEAAWAKTLNHLITHPTERSRLARRAWSRAQFFNLRKMAEGYLEAYRNILQPNTRNHANHSILPFTPVGLEPRQRSLPQRLRRRTSRART